MNTIEITHLIEAPCRRSAQAVAVLVVCYHLTLSCRANLYESPSWALLGTATGNAGYDSNLTFNRDGPGGAFGTAEAALLLERLNSLAVTKFSATLAETDFVGQKAPSQLDATGSFDIRYLHPDEVLPVFAASADWSRITQADPEINRRLRLEKTTANAGGRLLTSGEFGLDANIGSELYDYSADGLGRSYQNELKVGLAFDPTPLTEISANIAGDAGASSGSGGMPTVQERSESATVQVRGQVVPKITSTLYAGLTHIAYSGGYSNTSTLPTSGGDLLWSISPGKSLRGGVSLSLGFAPDGETQRNSQASLNYRQALSQAWSVELSLINARYSDRSTGLSRNDTSWSEGVSLVDAPSKRFDMSLRFSALHQTSNLPQAGFARYLTSVQANYHL